MMLPPYPPKDDIDKRVPNFPDTEVCCKFTLTFATWILET